MLAPPSERISLWPEAADSTNNNLALHCDTVILCTEMHCDIVQCSGIGEAAESSNNNPALHCDTL